MNQEEALTAIEQLYFAYRSFTEKPDQILKEIGLGRVHHRILYFVGRNPQININELLAILSVSKQALHGPLKKLIDSDLINVEPGQHDKRIKQLSLSKQGRSLEVKLTKTQIQHLTKAFKDVDPQAEQVWREIMAKIPL